MKYTLRNLPLLVAFLVGITASAQIPTSTSTDTPEHPVYIRNGSSHLFVKSNGAAAFAHTEGAQFVILSAGATDKYKIYNKTSNSWVNTTETSPTTGPARVSFEGNADPATATEWRIVQEGTTGKYDIYPADATTLAWNWNGGATATRAMGFYLPTDNQSTWYFDGEPVPNLEGAEPKIITNANKTNDFFIGLESSTNTEGVLQPTVWSVAKSLPANRAAYTWYRIKDGTNVRYYNASRKLYLVHKGFSHKPYNFEERDVTFTEQPNAKALWSIAANKYFVFTSAGATDQSDRQHNSATENYSTSFYITPTTDVVGLTIKAADYPVSATYTWNGASFTSTNGAAVTIYQPTAISYRARTLGITVNDANYEHRGYKMEGQTAYIANNAINVTLTANQNLSAIFQPAVFTTDIANPKWVRIFPERGISDKGLLSADQSMPQTLAAGTNNVVTKNRNWTSSDQLFALVGNRDEFKIYSRTAMNAVALNGATEGATTSLVPLESAAKFELQLQKDTQGTVVGYGLLPQGQTQLSLNHFGTNQTRINLGLAATATQSRWLIQNATQEVTVNVNVTGENPFPNNKMLAKLYATVNNTTLIEYTRESQKGQSFKLYVPAGASIKLVNDTFRGFLLSGMEHNGAALADNTAVTTAANATFNLNYAVDTNNQSQYIFYTLKGQVPYRIPALSITNEGQITAMADYRIDGADIGLGRVDIVMRRSQEGNSTQWTAESKVAQGTQTHGSYDYAFGDPAVVVNTKGNATEEVLVMAVGGNTHLNSANDTQKNHLVRIYSSDGGQTWEHSDVTSQFFGTDESLFKNHAHAAFFSSGRILQGNNNFGGTHNRLYAAILVKGEDSLEDNISANGTYVVYSDDFGQHWKVLGGVSKPHTGGNSNEPSIEQFEDGTILLSARASGGRYFNLFKFTDEASGTGQWGEAVFSNNVLNGLTFGSNSTHGQITLYPHARKFGTTVGNTTVALQTVPTGDNREKLTIFYREITKSGKEMTPAEIAAGWTKGIEISDRGSAYSTMSVLPKSKKLAIFYEEEPDGYNLLYRELTLREITNNEFYIVNDNNEADPSIVRQQAIDFRAHLAAAIEELKVRSNDNPEVEQYYTTSMVNDIEQELNNVSIPEEGDIFRYRLIIDQLNYIAQHINMALEFQTSAGPQAGEKVYLESKAFAGHYLIADPISKKLITASENNHRAVWQLQATDNEGYYNLYNPYLGHYLAALPTTIGTELTLTTKKAMAARYTFVNDGVTKYAAIKQLNAPTNAAISVSNNEGHTTTRGMETQDAALFQVFKAGTPNTSILNPALFADLQAVIKATDTGTNSGLPMGTGLGKFSTRTDVHDQALAVRVHSHWETMRDAIVALDGAIVYNLPKTGFYRFKGVNSGLYLDGVAKATNTKAAMNTAAETSANGIFYYNAEDHKLIAYGSGNFLGGAYNFSVLRPESDNLTFALPNGDNTKAGKYVLVANGSAGTHWIYDNGTTNGSADRYASYHENTEWEVQPISELPVTVTTAKYATFYSPVDVVIPNDVKVYTAVVSGRQVIFNRVRSNVLPAKTGVIIGANAGTYKFRISSNTAAVIENENHLEGSSEYVTLPESIYTLNVKDGVLKFYSYSGTAYGKFRAYLPARVITTEGGVQGMSFRFIDDDNVTGVNTLNEILNGETEIYDLQGRRRDSLQKGINIVNGKKVLVN